MKLGIFSWDNGGPWGNGKRTGGSGNGKTPRRVNNGGEPQPDLEDVVNQFKERLDGFWRGGGNNDDGRKLQLIGYGALALWVLSGLYIVAPDEQGVVQRFGAYVTTTEPGLHYHLPWPIETVTKPNVTRENVMTIGFRDFGDGGEANIPEESLMLTGDENIVDLDFTVRWKVADARRYLYNVVNVEETVFGVAESVMREVIGRHPIDDALAENKIAIQEQAKKHLQAVLDYYRAGVLVTGVDLQQVNPPNEVIDAFRDVQAARADAEKVINEARGYANRVLPLARGQAAQVLQDAEGYKAATVARAQGEAARFNAQVGAYRTAPEVTRQRLYMDTMEDVLQNAPKVVVTGKGGGNLLPLLPLDRLMPKQDKPEAAQ